VGGVSWGKKRHIHKGGRSSAEKGKEKPAGKKKKLTKRVPIYLMFQEKGEKKTKGNRSGGEKGEGL